MIPLPANLKLVLGVILVGGVAALQQLGKLDPALSWTGSVVQVLTALEMFFTIPNSAVKK